MTTATLVRKFSAALDLGDQGPQICGYVHLYENENGEYSVETFFFKNISFYTRKESFPTLEKAQDKFFYLTRLMGNVEEVFNSFYDKTTQYGILVLTPLYASDVRASIQILQELGLVKCYGSTVEKTV